MSEIKRWALTVCAAAVFSAILELLIPDKKYERLLRPVIAAFVVYAVLFPLADLPKTCSQYTAEHSGGEMSTRLRETVDRQAESIVRSAVEGEIRRAAGDIVLRGLTVEVMTETDGSGGIVITGAKLTLDSADRVSEGLIISRAAAASGLDREKIIVTYE